MGLAIASAVAALREQPEPLAELYSKTIEGNINSSRLQEEWALLRARMERTPPRHRKHYTPVERYQILVHKETYGLTILQTADAFLVSEQTICRWIAEATGEPEKKTVGSLLKAVPPLMSDSDVVRNLAVSMSLMGFGGNLKVAQTLARAGVKLSKESVRRWRQKQGPANPRKISSAGPKAADGPVLRAKAPNHVWMIYITHIPGLFGLFSFQLAVVIDVFSRMPLIGQVFISNPTANQMAELVRQAAAKHGSPKHFVSDQGSQFTAAEFCKMLIGLGAKQRFGAIGKSGSIAIIERFWRSVKITLRLKLWPTLTAFGLQERLLTGLFHFAYHRPHQGIGGATPAEMYYCLTQSCQAAIRPARAYESKTDDRLFEIAYLDPERFLPVLIPKALSLEGLSAPNSS
ncbi:MAG: transposase [Blastocatellia bacterium]